MDAIVITAYLNNDGMSRILFMRQCAVYALLLGVVIVLPWASVPFQFTKTIVVLFSVIALLLIIALTAYRHGVVKIPRSPIILALLVLPTASVIAALFSSAPGLSFVGYQIESDTVLFTLLISLIALVVSSVPRTEVPRILTVFSAGALLVCLLSLVQVVGSALQVFGFSNPIFNVIGRWNDLGVFAGLFAIFALTASLTLKLSKVRRVLVSGALVLALFLMVLVNVSEVWAVFGIVSFIALVIVVTAAAKRGGYMRAVVPALGVLVAACVLAWGAVFISPLQEFFTINTLEVRPSYEGTFDVVRGVYATDPLTGIGPNAFSAAWLLHRPQNVLGTPFWNTSFTTGVGTVPTAFVSGGLVVGAAWLVLSLFLVAGIVRSVLDAEDEHSAVMVVFTGLGVFYLLVMHYLYAPSQSLTFLLFFFIGLFLAARGVARSWFTVSATKRAAYGFTVGIILTAVVSLAALAGALQTYASAVYHQAAIREAGAGDISRAREYVETAISLRAYDQYFRTATLIELAQVNTILTGGDTSEAAREAFQAALASAVQNAERAVSENPNRYENHLVRSQVYASVVPLAIEGALENAISVLEGARALNPTTPAIDYLIAEALVASGAPERARPLLEQALAKKGNYTEAILLLAQIEYDAGEIEKAIEATKAAAFFEPTNPLLLYRLGILLLQNESYDEAAAALELTLGIQADFANAAFFLAQAYAFLDREKEALGIMETLEKENPDNELVREYREALSRGENPFSRSLEAPEVEEEAVE